MFIKGLVFSQIFQVSSVVSHPVHLPWHLDGADDHQYEQPAQAELRHLPLRVPAHLGRPSTPGATNKQTNEQTKKQLARHLLGPEHGVVHRLVEEIVLGEDEEDDGAGVGK